MKTIEVHEYTLEGEFITIEFEQNLAGSPLPRVVSIHIDDIDHYLESNTSSYDEHNKLREIWQYKEDPTVRTLKEGCNEFFEGYLEWYFNLKIFDAVLNTYDGLLDKKQGKIDDVIFDVGRLKAALEMLNPTHPLVSEMDEKYNSNTVKP